MVQHFGSTLWIQKSTCVSEYPFSWENFWRTWTNMVNYLSESHPSVVKTHHLAFRCGKYYKAEHWRGESNETPFGSFQHGEVPLRPLFAFQCLPRMQLYLQGDDCASSASVLVDTLSTLGPLRHASPLTSPVSTITLSIDIEGLRSVHKNVPINSTNLEFPVSLCHLLPNRQPFTLTCSAELELQSYPSLNEILVTSSPLLYLPSPISGSITSIDRKTGALMTRATNRAFQTVFPIGFYTDFGGYLAGNLSILDEIKSQGYSNQDGLKFYQHRH